MRSWEEKINGETEEKKMNRQADFTDGSSSFDDGFDKLYEKIKTMYRDDELETVKRAYETAKEHHKNQLRQSGVYHPPDSRRRHISGSRHGQPVRGGGAAARYG